MWNSSTPLFWRRYVLGLAVTKGPIFLRDFNKADEDIFLANLHSFVEMVRECFVEALLQLGGTAAIQCDLKKDAIVRPMYAEILSIEWQARLRVFRDYLKSVMLLPFPTLGYIGMAAPGVLSSVPFSPINLDKGPSTAAMDVELARLLATARLPALDAGRFVVLFIPGTRCLNAKPRQSSRSPHRNRTGSPPHHGRCGHVLRTRQRLREEVRRRHRRPGGIR